MADMLDVLKTWPEEARTAGRRLSFLVSFL